MATKKAAARWYVYELCDPRDGVVFYVGKGTGDRMHQHERDAACSSARTLKFERIRAIVGAGLEVQKQVRAQFWDEQAAYDHETDAIAEIGLENLTNVLPGGQKAWERRQVERLERKSAWTPMQAAKMIAAKNAWSGLAVWMRVEAGERVQVSGSQLVVMVWEAAVKALFPMLWKIITTSREAVEFCRPHLARHGVELAHGA